MSKIKQVSKRYITFEGGETVWKAAIRGVNCIDAYPGAWKAHVTLFIAERGQFHIDCADNAERDALAAELAAILHKEE